MDSTRLATHPQSAGRPNRWIAGRVDPNEAPRVAARHGCLLPWRAQSERRPDSENIRGQAALQYLLPEASSPDRYGFAWPRDEGGALEHFRAKPMPVRVKKMRQNRDPELFSHSAETKKRSKRVCGSNSRKLADA